MLGVMTCIVLLALLVFLHVVVLIQLRFIREEITRTYTRSGLDGAGCYRLKDVHKGVREIYYWVEVIVAEVQKMSLCVKELLHEDKRNSTFIHTFTDLKTSKSGTKWKVVHGDVFMRSSSDLQSPVVFNEFHIGDTVKQTGDPKLIVIQPQKQLLIIPVVFGEHKGWMTPDPTKFYQDLYLYRLTL